MWEQRCNSAVEHLLSNLRILCVKPWVRFLAPQKMRKEKEKRKKRKKIWREEG